MVLNSKEILYYCTRETDKKLTIYRGGNGGDVLAIAYPSVVTVTNDRQTNINFVDSALTTQIVENKQNNFFRSIQMSRFLIYDIPYHWEDYKTLLKDGTNHVIAKFHPTRLQGRRSHKFGKLDILETEMQDIIAVTALVLQKRSEEYEFSVPESILFSNCKGRRKLGVLISQGHGI